MGDFTKAGEIDHGLTPEPKIGDVYRDRAMLRRPASGFVHVTDVIPFEGEPQRVVLEDDLGKRVTMTMAALRRGYIFRHRTRPQ